MMRAWIVVIVLATAASLAGAQLETEAADSLDMGTYYDQWALPATVAEVQALCEAAGLGADGLAAGKALVEGCEARLKRDQHRMERAMEKSWLLHKPEENEARQDDMNKAMEKRTSSYDELSKSLLSDLRAIMPKDSDAAWAAFERRRHRRIYLHQGWRPGTAMDLVEVAQQEKIDSIPEVRDVLASYELELDRLLMARVPLMADFQKISGAAPQNPDQTATEKAFVALRDADCAIMHLQRASAERVLAAVPEATRLALRDKLLVQRWAYVQSNNTPLKQRVEKLIKSGRLEENRRKELERGIQAFVDKSRAVDEKHLAKMEDAECSRTYAQAMNPDNDDYTAWSEESRAAQAELLAVLERVATEEDLDAVADDQ